MSGSNCAIQVEHLSKRYLIGEGRALGTLRDAIVEKLSGLSTRLSPGSRRSRSERGTDRSLWALDDVTFEIPKGAIVGVIGRNGAGKSTLLKILARITPPTSGVARIRGSVGSLLEVGTGFHPELTGRDNVYLNGAVLGMKRVDIERKFDAIVDFSGVERFIDTPVKRYSSGMQVRLAFSVAAHLEPEVLLVDEVLAVGDDDFQKRCLGRLEEVSSDGRTILFVSHNMPAVLRVCPRVIFIDQGRVAADGPSSHVVRTYLDTGLGTTAHREWPSPATAPGDEFVRLKSVRVLCDGARTESVDIRKPVDIELEYWQVGSPELVRPAPGVVLRNQDGVTLFASRQQSDGGQPVGRRGITRALCHIPGNFLAEGQIFVNAFVGTPGGPSHVVVDDAVAFQIVDSLEGGTVRGSTMKEWPGVVRPKLDWTVEDDPQDIFLE